MSDLEKLTQAVAKGKAMLQTLKADMGNVVDNSAPAPDLINRVMNYMGSLQDQLGYISDTVKNQQAAMDDHMGDGHLPKAPSRAHMAKAITNLGWSDSYEAAPKQTVYAKRGPFLTIGAEVEI